MTDRVRYSKSRSQGEVSLVARKLLPDVRNPDGPKRWQIVARGKTEADLQYMLTGEKPKAPAKKTRKKK